MNIIKSIAAWFTGIALLAIFFPATFMAWLIVIPFDRNRSVIHRMLVYQSLVMLYMIPLWKIRIEGREKAVKGTTYVIISNHQSILDILLINSLRYRFRWISKIENSRVPLLGWYLKMAGYITVKRGDPDSKNRMLDQSYDCLKRNISIMLFPEGTRSADGQAGFFRRGAFELAIKASKPLLPVVIDGTAGILPKHGLIFREYNEIVVRVMDPVEPGMFATNDCDILAGRIRQMMIDELNKLRDEKWKRE
jgi:1-acyl-sn-glycerol-3-phosphate acyltransferase